MGAVAEYIHETHVILTVILNPYILVINDYGAQFEDYIKDHFADLFGLFGIEEQDVINVEASSQLILQDVDALTTLWNELALKHQLTQRDPIDLLSTKTAPTSTSFRSFYDYGATSFYDGLPTSNIDILTVPTDAIKAYLDALFSINCTLITSKIDIPSIEAAVYTYLTANYECTPYNNFLVYNTYSYKIDTIYHDTVLDKYKADISRPATETTEVTVTITPYIEAYPTYSNTTQYYIGDHVMFDNGSTVDAYICDVDSLGNLPTDTNFWTQVDYDSKETVTEVTVTVEEGIYSYTTNTVTTLIPAGSESNSYTSNSVPTTVDPVTISVNIPPYTRHFVVTYHFTNDAEYYYWIYEIGSGEPTLDVEGGVTNIEMLPIVTLRENKVNFNANPLSTTYNDTQKILSIIGLDGDQIIDGLEQNASIADVTDAFISFTVDLKDTTDYTISKVVYNTFDFAYYDVGGVQGYKTTITEGPFNLSMGWQSQTRSIKTGVVCPVEECRHYIEGLNVRVVKQVNVDTYIEYVMTNVNTLVLINQAGLYGGHFENTQSSGPLLLALSQFFVEDLTPVERVHIFGKALRMNIYAAQITHLEYYETPEFATFLRVVGVIVTIILAIFGYFDGGGILGLIENLAIGAAGALAIKALFEAIDDPVLAAIVAIVAAVVLTMYGGGFDMGNFFSAEMVSTLVSEFAFNFGINLVDLVSQYIEIQTEQGMEELEQMSYLFSTALKERQAELEAAGKSTEAVSNFIDTYSLAKLLEYEKPGYIEGYDMLMYRARDIQYDFSQYYDYDSKFDYDIKYKVGLI